MILTYLEICIIKLCPSPPIKILLEYLHHEISWVSPFEQIWSAYLPHLVKSVAPWSFVKCGGITRVTSSLPWILVPRMCLHEELGRGVREVWNGWMYNNYLQITLWIHFQPYEQVMLGNWNWYLSLTDDQLVTRANLGCFVLFKLSLHNRQFLCSQSLRASHGWFQTESTSQNDSFNNSSQHGLCFNNPQFASIGLV